MSLVVLDTLSMQLVLIPLYLLCVLSFFCIHQHRRARLLPTAVRIQSDHIAVYSYGYICRLAAPFALLFFMLLSSIRAYEGVFFLSQMLITAWHLKFFFFSLFFFCASHALYSLSPIASSLPYVSELVLSLVWLYWAVCWALCVSGLILFIFFLEVFGLLLLTALLYIFVTGRGVSVLGLNNKLFNATYGAKFFFIQAFLFFLWSSIFSMLFLFWSSLYISSVSCTLDLALVELFYEFSLASGSLSQGGYWILGVCGIFFTATLIKVAIVPLQFWLIAFYKHLPLYALFVYLSFYYLYFVIVIMTLFFGYLYPLTPLWYWYSITVFGLGSLYAVPSLLEAMTVRGFFAYSSAINLFMLFIFMLTPFDFY